MTQPVRIELYREPEQLTHAIPGMRLRATPLARGEFRTRIVTWSLDGLVSQAGMCSPLAIEFAVGGDISAFQVPLLNRHSLLLNGRSASGNAVGLYGGGAELLRANTLCATYGTLVLPTQSVEALLCPPAGLALTRPGAHGMLAADPGAWRRMAAVINAAARAGARAPAEPGSAAPRAGLRASLLDAARGMLAQGRDGEPARRLNARVGWARIVKGAQAYLDAHSGRAIYTEELCTRHGITSASLGEAFRQVLGTTPHRFLKLRRLAMVRAALLDRDAPPALVKSAALAHGFWHLGQFAQDYRAMYGETPSETLAQTHGQRGAGAAGQDDGRNQAGAWLRTA